MQYRRFGNTDLTTSEVGFGCARIGGVFQGSSRLELVSLLRCAFDHGVTFFDTADMYTQGESERLVGEAFQHDRSRVVIATKFGYRSLPHKRVLNRVKPLLKPLIARLGLKSQHVHASLRGTVSQQDFSPAYLASALEASLRRLKTDYIDIYQLHDPPLEVLERGEFVESLDRLRQQGKVRHWGVACQQPEDALVSLGYPSIGSIQVGLSVLEQAALDAAIPRAAERGTGIIARQVFASGLLTRRVDLLKLEDIDSDPEVAVRKRDQLAAYAAIAQRCGRTPTEMALQFALARPDVSVVLLGISRADQVEPNLRALQANKLTAEEQRLLTASRRPGR
ncbi:MAG TPA: aldo/keto reductase [Ktedonobacterales bacterium]|nr:aldo/keto reductase [Ktedonobacterales bacterium]